MELISAASLQKEVFAFYTIKGFRAGDMWLPIPPLLSLRQTIVLYSGIIH